VAEHFVVTPELVEQYSADGVVMLRNAVSPDWIEVLGRGMDRGLANPTARARTWNRDEQGGTTHYDGQAWLHIPEYKDFVLNGPLGAIAGEVMGCSRINFFFDTIFVRTTGVQFRTPFHQDEPYWSVEGFDCSSAWMPLNPVEKRSSLEFVKGSHRWNNTYEQVSFGAMVGDVRDEVNFGSEAEPFPDVEGDRNSFEILSWDMAPGDVALFNARMIHGGSGLLAPDRDLRVFNTQWLGDDARVCFRPEGMDPDHSEVMTAQGLSPGDRVGTDMYPLVWWR